MRDAHRTKKKRANTISSYPTHHISTIAEHFSQSSTYLPIQQNLFFFPYTLALQTYLKGDFFGILDHQLGGQDLDAEALKL